MSAKMQEATSIMAQQYNATHEDIVATMLPDTEVPAGYLLTAYGAIFVFLQNWSVAGAAPFDLEAFDVAAGPSFDVIDIVKKLVGVTWDKFYAAAPPEQNTVAPRQIALLISRCLTRVKMAFDTAEQKIAIDAMATNAQAAAEESAKRLRTE